MYGTLNMFFVGSLILTVTSIGAMPMPMPMPRPISGDVEHVTVSEIFMEQTRIKRSNSGDCQFPPTLLFQFDVQGEKVILQLEKNVLLSRRIPIYVTKNGQSYQEKINDAEEEFATYQDVVRGSSMLVFYQEDGTFKLHGSFRHAGEMYRMSHSGVPEPSPIHYIQRSEEISGSYRNDFAMPPNETYDELLESTSMRSKSCRETNDSMGETDKNIIELFFTTDASVYQYFLDDFGSHKIAIAMLELYFVLLANEMDLYFHSVTLVDPSLSIKIYVAGVEVPEPGSDASWSRNSQFVRDDVTYVDFDIVLKYVKKWTRKHENDVQYDHVMAVTRLNLVDKDLTGIYVGKAVIGKLCYYPKSISVIGTSWTQAAATASHELAHNLGAYHDGTSSATSCSMFDLNLMSPVLPFATNLTYAETITTFSVCSVEAFKCHINRLGDENCMKQHSFSDSEFEAQKALPFSGTVYSLDQQCQFFRGLSSSSCAERLNESSCYTGFVCSTSPILPDGCNPDSFPLYPLAGTPCGESDDDKWCYKGLCRPRQTSTPGTTTSTTVSSFCSKKCCIRKSSGKKKCCNGIECCEVKFGQKLDCCTLCNQVSQVSTTVTTTLTTSSEQCYEGECCKRILNGDSKKKVCCTGKKCCKRSWGINTKCCKTCG